MTDDAARPPRTPEQIALWLREYRDHHTPRLPTHAEMVALARAYLALLAQSRHADGVGTLALEGQILVTDAALRGYQRHAASSGSPVPDETARRDLLRLLLDAEQDPQDLALWRYRSRSRGDQIDISARAEPDAHDPRIVSVIALSARPWTRRGT